MSDVPAQVERDEWIISGRSSDKYREQLGAINRGDYER